MFRASILSDLLQILSGFVLGLSAARIGSILPLPRETTGVRVLVHAALADEERRERIYELAWAAYADPEPAMKAASEVPDRAFGPRATYSRKPSVPLPQPSPDTPASSPSPRPPPAPPPPSPAAAPAATAPPPKALAPARTPTSPPRRCWRLRGRAPLRAARRRSSRSGTSPRSATRRPGASCAGSASPRPSSTWLTAAGSCWKRRGYFPTPTRGCSLR